MYAPYNILHLICLKHIPSACLRPLFQTTCLKPVFQTACLRLVFQPLVNLCSTLGSELQYTSYLYQTDTLNLYDTTSFKPCSTLIQPLVSTLRLTTIEPYCSTYIIEQLSLSKHGDHQVMDLHLKYVSAFPILYYQLIYLLKYINYFPSMLLSRRVTAN